MTLIFQLKSECVEKKIGIFNKKIVYLYFKLLFSQFIVFFDHILRSFQQFQKEETLIAIWPVFKNKKSI